MTPEEKQALMPVLMRCIRSSEMMGRAFFPHHITRKFSPEHQKMFRILDNPRLRRAAIAAPRHFGKTTIDGLFFPARETLFRNIRYGLFISATQEKAIDDLTTFKREMTWNPRVKKVFGTLKPASREMKFADMAFELAFRDDDGQIRHTCKWAAKGANQQFRGIKYGNQRPDLIIIDDFEDPEEVDKEDLRKKRKRRFYADIMKSIDIKQTRVVVLGTVLHEAALLVELLESPRWHSCLIELCNDEFVSNWPEFMSDEEILADYKEYEAAGEADTWMREVRNKVVSLATMSFTPNLFRHYSEGGLLMDIQKGVRDVETAVIVDPAREIKVQNDDSAIIGVSVDHTMGAILVRDLVHGRMMPDQIYQEATDMANRLNTVNIGIEDHGLHQFIKFPFQQHIMNTGRYYNVTWLKPGSKEKNERIKTLLPLYRQGLVWHNDSKHVFGPLESQLMSFPRAKKDDVSDALAYMNQMFDVNDVFVQNRPIHERKSQDSDILDPHSMPIEYAAALDGIDEGVLDGSWRWAA